MKKIVDLVLKNQLLTLLLIIAVVGFGLICFFNTTVDAFPDATDKTVQIITQYEGKASEEVESLITIPMENGLIGLPHSTQIRSETLSSLSVIYVMFDDQIDIYLARQLILERLNSINLPEGAESSLGPLSTPIGEIYRYVIQSDSLSPMELRTIQDWTLKRELKKVPGVADVTILGGLVKQYQVLVDPIKLNSFDISLNEVSTALSQSNRNTGGGYLKLGSEQFNIRGVGQLSSVEDIENVVVKVYDGVPVKLENLADVQISNSPRFGIAGHNDYNEVVEGVVLLRAGENPYKVLNAIKKRVEELKQELPKSVHFFTTYDRSELVGRTIDNLKETLLFGILLVFIVLLIFTGHLSLALIITIVVPLSLLFTFILMRYANVNANLLSLGAIDFGIIIDGSVVMAEAIFVSILLNHPKTKEQINSLIGQTASLVGKPILFSKLIIIFCLAPLFFLERVEGRLFKPLALTMSFAIIGALFFTITLVPILCSMFLKPKDNEKEPWIITKIERIYEPFLNKAITKPRKILTFALIAMLSSWCLIPILGSEFMPKVEEGGIWIRSVLPVSVSIDEAHSIAPNIIKVVRSFPQVKSATFIIGRQEDATDPDLQNIIEVLIDLTPRDKWGMNKAELNDKINLALQENFPGIDFYLSQPLEDNVDEAISGVKGQVAVKIFGPDFKVLQEKSKEIYQTIKDVRGIDGPLVDKLNGFPQLVIEVDREACAKYGINVEDVQNIIEIALAGKQVTEFIEGEKRFDTVVRLLPEYRNNLDVVKRLQIPSPDGKLRIPLIQLAKFKEIEGVPLIFRENLKRRGSVRFAVKDRDMGGLVAEARKLVEAKVSLPKGYSVVWSGQFESQERAMKRLSMIIPISFFCIFMLLFIQFGNLKDVLIILTTVPLAMIGGILGLLFMQIHLSVSAIVGFIALSGVSVQNGVILVSSFNRFVSEGLELKDAVERGMKDRLRAVITTAMLASLGLLPAVISTGTGSETQKPLATVIVFGMISALILTLVVLPALYTYVKSKFSFKELKA